MSAPLPVTLSPHAKTTVASVVAVVMAGVTAYQVVTAGGHFTWWDVLPIAAAVLGVATTDQVDNTIGSPRAKAVVHGALSALAAVTAALTTLVGSEPSGVSLAKLAVAALGTLAVWAYPELAPALAPAVTGGKVTPVEIKDALRLVAGDVSASMGPEPAAAPLPPVPAPAVTPRQADTVPSAAYLVRDLPAPAAGPTPIGDAALAAATATGPMPAAAVATAPTA